MLTRYERAFTELGEFAVRLNSASPAELPNICLEMQRRIIGHLRRVETLIRKWKSRNPRTDKVIERIKIFQRIHRTLRGFGDAIAFRFIDRWDVRALARNNSAGFISGKSGFNQERSIMRSAIARGTPALMADLTNFLRHGDVFLFPHGEQFQVIESKLGKSGGGRGRRQKRRLLKQLDYLEDDVTDYRGQELRRVSCPRLLESFEGTIRDMFDEATTHDYVLRQVAIGVRYLLIRTTADPFDVLPMLNDGFGTPGIAIVKSDDYTNGTPVYPIQLVLRNPTQLAQFLCGKFMLVFGYDLNSIVSLAKHRGANLTFIEDESSSYAFEMYIADRETEIKVSRNMFTRFFMEFWKPEWFMDAVCSTDGLPSALDS